MGSHKHYPEAAPPSISARGAHGTADGHRHLPPRVPVCFQSGKRPEVMAA
jgi:hypothetical protein